MVNSKYGEGSGRSLFQRITLTYAWRGSEKPLKNPSHNSQHPSQESCLAPVTCITALAKQPS